MPSARENTPPLVAPARRRAAPRRPAWRRLRRVLLGAALICLLPPTASLVAAMSKPSNSSFPIRVVEWLRDNGGRGFVNRVESTYYSLTAPPRGGPGLRALPQQPDATPAAVAAVRARHEYRPPRVRSAIRPALPGEGVWHATLAGAGAHPPVLVTSFRSDVNYPREVAGVAWIDHTRTRTFLYPGRQEPPVSIPRGAMEVPPRLRGRLVATFNSGFKLADSGGGFAVGGHTYAPLKAGIATIVLYRSGHVDVKGWNGGPSTGPNVVFARQNLPLIVNHGRANPNLADGPEWGATLGNAVRVWRSGVGVDRHGNALRGRQQPDRRLAGGDPDPGRGGPGDGARHQLLLGQLHHLPPPRGRRPGEPPGQHDPSGEPLSDGRRPRLLRRLLAVGMREDAFEARRMIPPHATPAEATG